jgi:hypothetical protein
LGVTKDINIIRMPIEKNFTEKIEKADKVEFELYKHNR